MAIWNKPVLTKQAIQLITQDLWGDKEIVFTRIEYGDGRHYEGEDLSERKDLMNTKQTFPISSAMIIDDHVRLRAIASNKGVREPYEIWEVGIFARSRTSGKEILFSVAAAEKADTFPADDGIMHPCEILQEYYIYVVDDLKVSVETNGAYVTVRDFEEYQEKIRQQFEDLPIVKIGIEKELDRKDTILLEKIEGTEKVFRIQEKDHEDNRIIHDLAAVFELARERQMIKSEETLGELFGKIGRYLTDLKQLAFKESDNPFVLMTTSTYKPPSTRSEGCLYGLITKTRGLVVLCFDRYVSGLETPLQKRTLYGVEIADRTVEEKAEGAYVGVITNIVFFDNEGPEERETYKLYAKITTKKG